MAEVAGSDPIPLDGAPELTSAERLAVRRWLRDQERMSWARRKIRPILVVLASVIAGGGAVFGWVRDHIIFR